MSATLDGMNTAQLQDLIARAEATIKAQEEKARAEVFDLGTLEDGDKYAYDKATDTLTYLGRGCGYKSVSLYDGRVSYVLKETNFRPNDVRNIGEILVKIADALKGAK